MAGDLGSDRSERSDRSDRSGSDDRAEVHVAFLGGTGRSGSTLVSRVLGSVPGACSVGELCWLWSYGLVHDRPCGCGEPFSRCAFWRSVGEAAFGGWAAVDAERATELRRRLTSNRAVPRLWRPSRPAGADVDEYTTLLAALYRGIRDVSGAAVVVDNSKQVAAALLARRAPGVRMDLVHLVRRSHGVAYSWTKKVARSDSGAEMRRRSPGRTAVRWTADNALLEAMGRTGTPRLLVRYEDVVADLPRELDRMLTMLGLPLRAADLDFVADGAVRLSPDHSVWGNPMRLRTGWEQLRPDEQWRTGMPAGARRVVTALSAPALARYGYVGSARR